MYIALLVKIMAGRENEILYLKAFLGSCVVKPLAPEISFKF
jgi:hypothetical protein